MPENLTHWILVTITVLAISGAFVQAARFMAEKLKDTKIGKAADAVADAVEYVNQTFVNDLKASGDFTISAQMEAMGKAVNAAFELMGESTVKYIEKVFGNAETWITTKAEAYIAESKPKH